MDQVWPLPSGGLMLPRPRRYYGPLRLPLRPRPLHGLPLIGSGPPSPPLGRHPRGLTAGAETGLSCSHDGYPSVPRPLRHRVLRCCISKLFTPSMAFAHGHQARLPVGPFRGKSSRRGRLRFMLRTGGLHSPIGSLTPRVDAQVSPNAGGLLQRVLVPPLAGLSPASHRELPGHAVRHFFVQHQVCRMNSALHGASLSPDNVIPAKAGIQPRQCHSGEGRNPGPRSLSCAQNHA